MSNGAGLGETWCGLTEVEEYHRDDACAASGDDGKLGTAASGEGDGKVRHGPGGNGVNGALGPPEHASTGMYGSCVAAADAKPGGERGGAQASWP